MLQSTKPVSPYQFAMFRILLGLFLLWQVIALIAFDSESYGIEDRVPGLSIDLPGNLFPHSPVWFGESAMVTILLSLGLLGSVLLTLGPFRRMCGVVLCLVLACLVNQESGVANLSLPYLGLILLLCACVPPGDALALGKKNAPPENWHFPSMIYWIAWSILALGYTVSGVIKFDSPSWMDGSALTHILNHPLARTGWIRDWLVALPHGLIKVFLWTTMGLQAGFVLFSFHRLTRLLAWTSLLFLHIGLILFIGFTDLGISMILVHLFIFDPDWFPARKPASKTDQVVFFDGDCLLCKGSVQFLMTEDHQNVLTFAKLQGETAKDHLPEEHQELRSILYLRDGDISSRSTAILDVLDATGGIWRPLSWIGRMIPRPARDFAYDTIARNRYKWFGHQEDACSVLPPSQRSRIVD